MNDGFYAFCGAVWLVIMACFTAYNCGLSDGREQAASGQVECRLEEQADKTSKWKCEEKGE